MSKMIDLTGQRFGRLTVIERAENKGSVTAWRCKCDCGGNIVTAGSDMKRGRVKSCGCLRKEVAAATSVKSNTTHGKRHTRLYVIWRDIKQRCNDENSINYHNYGGRGIKVCNEWKDNFQAFYDWSMSHGYTDDLTIDRINVNGDYSPDNCRWITAKEQCNNTRNNVTITYNGKSQTLAQWSEELNISYDKLWKRIQKYHWTIERSFCTP